MLLPFRLMEIAMVPVQDQTYIADYRKEGLVKDLTPFSPHPFPGLSNFTPASNCLSI